MHIACVIASLGAGGAERVLTRLVNDWVAQGHRVSLLTFMPPGKPSHYPLAPAVSRRDLDLLASSHGLWQGVRTNGRRISVLRRALLASQPDVVLAFVDQTNILTLLAARGTGLPVVISERIHPAHHPIGRLWQMLRRWVYPLADALVVQTTDIASWVEKKIGQRARVIANPAPEGGECRSLRPTAADRIRIVAIGRLHRQKGFDILISALAALPADLPPWEMVILGEGTERARLERQLAACGLSTKVVMPGVVPDVSAHLARADIFVLPSRFEGFPNALMEALACDVPVIATDCPGGSAEILQNGRFGLLVPVDDSEALCVALADLIASPERRAAFSAASQQALAPYRLAKISKAWLDLFAQVQQLRSGGG